MKGFKNQWGYSRVFINGKSPLLSRIVAQAFPEICGEWFEGCQVDHISGNKDDNSVYNLRVCTQTENQNNRNTLVNRKNSKGHIPIEQLSKDGEHIMYWSSAGLAAKKLGIQALHIFDCCEGRMKSTGGYKWRYYKPEVMEIPYQYD